MSVKTLPMPKKRSEEKTATIRVTESIAKMIETICLAEGITSSKVASPILEKAIRGRYIKAITTINEQAQDFGIRDQQ